MESLKFTQKLKQKQMIKKRTRKIQSIRTANDDDQQQDVNEDNNSTNTVDIIKAKQKLKKQRGCVVQQDTGDLFDTKSLNEKSTKRQQATMNVMFGGSQGGLVSNDSFHKEDDILTSINSKFASKTSKSDAEKKMEQYIESEMKKKGYLTTDEKEEMLEQFALIDKEAELNQKQDKSPIMNINDLYKIPEHLQVSRSLFKDDQNKTAPNEVIDKETQERTQLMTGGIVEVHLPKSYKHKNIAETDKASRSHRQPITVEQVIDNTTVKLPVRPNYAAFHPEKQSEQTDNEVRKHMPDDTDNNNDPDQQQQQKQPSQSKKRKQTSTDEQTYDRFIKRYRKH
jgi:hypothetical protein